MHRREFIQSSAAAAGAAMFAWPQPVEAQTTAPTIGIQVGAVSFLDEGTDKVLDTFVESANINTLFLATFTPEDVHGAVQATFDAGAHGLILSRKYSEMRLANLRAAGRAIREVTKAAV
jgi:hypothetical protein